MSVYVRKRVGTVVGWTLLIVGVVGLVLPFLQGVLFIVVGIVLLSKSHAWARALLVRVASRCPVLYGRAARAAARYARVPS